MITNKKAGPEGTFRFFHKDGTVHIRRTGLSIFTRVSLYNSLIQMSRGRLWLTLSVIYLILNLIFACIYMAIGIENIQGVKVDTLSANFLEAFFFSAQTFTTVGYGHISPAGITANIVVTIEAFVGLSCFAMVSGVFYARFARPRPFLYFSKVAVLTPGEKGKSFAFRVVPYKNHYLVEAEIKLSLVIRTSEGHNDFYQLPVERNRLDALVLNWTIIHPVTEDSPLFRQSLEDLRKANAEFFVYLKAHDEIYATPVVARTSYTVDEIVDNARFKKMYHPADKGDITVLHVDMLDEYELITPPKPA